MLEFLSITGNYQLLRTEETVINKLKTYLLFFPFKTENFS